MGKNKKIHVWLLIISIFITSIQWPLISARADILKDLSLDSFEADIEYPFLMVILNKENGVDNYYAVKSSMEMQYMSEYGLVVTDNTSNIKYVKHDDYLWKENNEFKSEKDNILNKLVLFKSNEGKENAFKVLEEENIKDENIQNLADGNYILGYTGISSTSKLTNYNYLNYDKVEETKVKKSLLAKEIVDTKDILISKTTISGDTNIDFSNISPSDKYTLGGINVQTDDISWSPTSINWNTEIIETSDGLVHNSSEFLTLSNGVLSFYNSFPVSAILKLTGSINDSDLIGNNFIFYMYLNANKVYSISKTVNENETIEDKNNIYLGNTNNNLTGSDSKNEIANDDKANNAELKDEGGMDQGSANNNEKDYGDDENKISDTARKAYNNAITNSPKQNALKNQEENTTTSYSTEKSNTMSINDTTLKNKFLNYSKNNLTGGFKGLDSVNYSEVANSSQLNVTKSAILGVKKDYPNEYKLYSEIFYPVYKNENKSKSNITAWEIKNVSTTVENINDFISINNNKLTINQNKIAEYRKNNRDKDAFNNIVLSAKDSTDNSLTFDISVKLNIENDSNGYIQNQQTINTGKIIYTIKNNSTGQYGKLPKDLKHLDIDNVYHSLINYGEYQLLYFSTQKPIFKTVKDKDFRLNFEETSNVEIWKNENEEWEFFNYTEKLDEGYVALPPSGEKSIEYVNYILLNESNNIIIEPNTVDNSGNIKIRQTKLPIKYLNGGNNSILSNSDGYNNYYVMLSNNLEYFIYKTKEKIKYNEDNVIYPSDYKTYNLVQNTWILCDDDAEKVNKYFFTNKDDFTERLIFSNDEKIGVPELTINMTGAIDYFRYIPYYGARNGYHYIISDSGDNFNAIEYRGATAVITNGRVQFIDKKADFDLKQKRYSNLTWIDVNKEGSTSIKDKDDIADNLGYVKIDSFSGSILYSDIDLTSGNTTVFDVDFANSMIVTNEMSSVDFNCKKPSLKDIESFPNDLSATNYSDVNGNLVNYFLIEENNKYTFYAFPKKDTGTMFWNSTLSDKDIYLTGIEKNNFTGIACEYNETTNNWKYSKKIVTDDYKLITGENENDVMRILDLNEDDGFYYVINHNKVAWFGIDVSDINTTSGIVLSRDETKKFYGSTSIGTTTYIPEGGTEITIIDGSTIAKEANYIQPMENKNSYYIQLIEPLDGVYDPLTQYNIETEEEFKLREGYGKVLTSETEKMQLYIPMFNTAIRTLVGTVLGDGIVFDLNGKTNLLRNGSWYQEIVTNDTLSPDIDMVYAAGGQLKIKATDNPEPQIAIVNEVVETGQPAKDVAYYFVDDYEGLKNILWEKIPKDIYDYLNSSTSGSIVDFGNLSTIFYKYMQDLNNDINNLTDGVTVEGNVYYGIDSLYDQNLLTEIEYDELSNKIEDLENDDFNTYFNLLDTSINNLSNEISKSTLQKLTGSLIEHKKANYKNLETELNSLHTNGFNGTIYEQIKFAIENTNNNISTEAIDNVLDILDNNEGTNTSETTKTRIEDQNYYRSINIRRDVPSETEPNKLKTDDTYFIKNNIVYFGGVIAPRRIITGINISTGEDIVTYYSATGLSNVYIVLNTPIITISEVNTVDLETGTVTKVSIGQKLETGTIIQLDSKKTIKLLPYGSYGIFASDKTGNRGMGEYEIIDGKRELISGKQNKEVTIELNSENYDNMIHYPTNKADQEKVNGYEDVMDEIQQAIENSRYDTESPDILYAYIYKRNLIVVTKDKSQSIDVPVAGFFKGEWNTFFHYTDFTNKNNKLAEEMTFLDKASNTKTLSANSCSLGDIIDGKVIGLTKPINFYKSEFEFSLIKDETKKIEEGTLNFTVRDKNNNQSSTTRDIAVSEETNNTVIYGTCNDDYILKMLEKAREEDKGELDAWPIIKSIYTLNGILYVEATDDKGIEEYGYQFRYSSIVKEDTMAKRYTYINSKGEVITELNKKLNKGTTLPSKATIYKNEYYQSVNVPTVMTIFVTDNYKDEKGTNLHTISRQITVTNENEIIYGEVSDEIKDAIEDAGGDVKPDINEGPKFTSIYTYQGYLYLEGFSKAGLTPYAYGYQPNENMIIPSYFTGINDTGDTISIEPNKIIQSGTKIYKNTNFQKIKIPIHIRVWLKDINNKTTFVDLFVDKDNYLYLGKVPPELDGSIEDPNNPDNPNDPDDPDNPNNPEHPENPGGTGDGPIEPGDDDNVDGDKVKPDEGFDDIDWNEYDYVFELLDYDTEEVVYRIRKDKAETIQLPKLEDSAHYLYYQKAVSEIDNTIYKTIYGDFYMEDETPPVITKITYNNNRIYVSAYDAGDFAKKPYSFAIVGARNESSAKYQESNSTRVIVGDVVKVSVKDDEGNISTVQVTIKENSNSVLYECVNAKKPLSIENETTKTVSYWLSYLKDEYDININNVKLTEKNNPEKFKFNTQGTTITFNFEGYGSLNFYDEKENKFISLALRTTNAGKSYRSIIVELGSETNFELVFKKKLIETFGSLNGITWAVDTDYLDKGYEDMIEANYEGIGRIVAKKNGVKETFYVVVAKKISKVTSNANFTKENFAYTYLVGNTYKLSKALSMEEEEKDEDKKTTTKTKKENPLYVVIDKYSDGIKITTDKDKKENFKVTKKGIQTITLLDVVNDKIFEAKFEGVSILPHISQFSDIIGSESRSDIEYLSERGVIVEYPDERFKPNNKMTTKELLTMLNRVRLSYDDDFEVEKQSKKINISEKDFDYYASMNILINLNQSEVDKILSTNTLNKAVSLNEVVDLISATLLYDDYHNESNYTTPSGLTNVSESALHLLSIGILTQDEARNGTREVTRAEIAYMLTQTVKYLES